MSDTTETTPIKETIRRFNVTANIVINTENHKEATDETIKATLENLLDFAFSKANPNILLEANTVKVEEVAL